MCMTKKKSDTPITEHRTAMLHLLSKRLKKDTVRNEEGQLLCYKCHAPVVIDWFEYELECLGCDEL